MDGGGIHYENPFVDPPGARSAGRRLRGRLASPVTLWTAGGPESPAGLTVSSLIVADGEPASILGLISDTTELYEALTSTGRFVVHVFEEGQRLLADRFAGLRPSPGGIFSDLEVIPGPYGPQVAGIATRAFCRLAEVTEQGYQHLVRGDIDGVELGELERPLVHFRGRYRPLSG